MAAEYVQRIGERIAERRKAAGLTQLELALALPGKVGADQVSRWERGIHRPEDETLEEIAAVLKVPISYFMTEAPDKTVTPSPFGGQDAIADRLDQIDRDIESMRDLLETLVVTIQALSDGAQPKATGSGRKAT